MSTRNLLFLCGRNKARSPTAERLFASLPGFSVASAGVSADAEEIVTPALLEWADIIFVMERRHRAKLQRDFRDCLRSQRVICLDIPDEYNYMDEALVARLAATVPKHLGVHV